MQLDERQLMMRLFFANSSEGAFCMEGSEISGLVLKDDVARALSDLSARGLPVRRFTGQADIEKFFPRYCYTENDKEVILVVNRQAELIGTFGLHELVSEKKSVTLPFEQNDVRFGNPVQSESEIKPEVTPKIQPIIKIPESFIVHKNVTDEEFAHLTAPLLDEKHLHEELTEEQLQEPNESDSHTTEPGEPEVHQTRELKHAPKLNRPIVKQAIHEHAPVNLQQGDESARVQTTPNEVLPRTDEKSKNIFIGEGSENTFKKSIKKVRTDMERARLVTATLEALVIPLTALDTEGEELFYNDEWLKLRARYPGRLDNFILLTAAKEMIMQRAIEGGLEKDETIDLRGLLRGRVIRVRAIRPDADAVMPVGYLFWLEPAPLNAMPFKPNEKNDRAYTGRTLPDILADEERRALVWALEQAGGNQTNAAMLLGIPRQTFAYKLRKLTGGNG